MPKNDTDCTGATLDTVTSRKVYRVAKTGKRQVEDQPSATSQFQDGGLMLFLASDGKWRFAAIISAEGSKAED